MSRFDEVVDRRNTNSLKVDFAVEFGKPADILPLWVADMDFRAPQEVNDALRKVTELGIYGYSQVKEDYARTVAGWFGRRFGWEPKAEWMVKTPGVVFAINHAIRAYTEPGDAVLIQQPVYYPFAASIRDNGRTVVNNELVYREGRYSIDMEDFEKKIRDENVKLFILCSPHNPVGRVWTREELEEVARICLKYRVPVVSDEIHCDFTYPGHEHTIFSSLSEETAQNCILCTAPSKTFNLAGLQASNIFIPNEKLRKAFIRQLRITGCDELNIFALAGCRAAYEYGADWLEELKEYLSGNLQFVREFLKKEIPQIRLVEPEGTYLVWLDCAGLGLAEEELTELMVNRAKLWLDGGSMFGGQSAAFERVNIACPRATLERGMEQLKTAVNGR